MLGHILDPIKLTRVRYKPNILILLKRLLRNFIRNKLKHLTALMIINLINKRLIIYVYI